MCGILYLRECGEERKARSRADVWGNQHTNSHCLSSCWLSLQDSFFALSFSDLLNN